MIAKSTLHHHTHPYLWTDARTTLTLVGMAYPVVPVGCGPVRADLLPERPCEHPAQSREEVAAIEAFYAEEEEVCLPASET